jgi:hypothetical protein
LYADLSRSLPVVDPDNRELILSCGASLEHLLIAAKHFGYDADCELFPEPQYEEYLAKVTLGTGGHDFSVEDELFRAIATRHTNRFPFRDQEIPRPILESLRQEANAVGARLDIVTDTETKRKLIEMIAQNDRKQVTNNHDFVGETFLWTRGNHGTAFDGIPMRNMGDGGLLSTHMNDLGEAQVEKSRMLTWSASGLATVCTTDDQPHDWIVAGRALARVLLRAAANSLQASFFNSPVERADDWPTLHQFAGQNGLPQVIFRLGYPIQEALPTPRRPLEQFVTSSQPTIE